MTRSEQRHFGNAIADAVVRRVNSSWRRAMGSGVIALVLGVSVAQAAAIKIVAAENVYGDIAIQIGGADVAVTSILTSPTQDPHEFEASVATARAIADARVVIYNGADYDPWAVKLLSASKSSSRVTIEVAALTGRKAGANPHLWYDVAAVSALATTLAAKLAQLDPAHRADYAERVAAFETSMAPLRERIAAMRKRYAGTPVTATEPLFDYMAASLGLAMPADARGRRLALQHANRAGTGQADAHHCDRGRSPRRHGDRDRTRRTALPAVDELATRRARSGASRKMNAR
jgi:zinc/manganese transport system substrate-binding protein